jgi:hypothetical protein
VAFSYLREKIPPVTVEEVIGFYEECGFDYGVSVDHVILAYQPELDQGLPGLDVVPEEWRGRQEITQELADQFLRHHGQGKHRFIPLGDRPGPTRRAWMRFGTAPRRPTRFGR